MDQTVQRLSLLSRILAFNMKKDILFIIAVGVLTILAAFYFLNSSKVSEVAFAPVDVGGGSITITDQNQLDFVSFQAELVKPGFITIHRTISTAPAGVIGTTELLKAGNHDLILYLTNDMQPGFKYAAILHLDDGDGVFVAQEDFPVITNGEVVRPYFLAIPEAETILDPASSSQ